MPLPLKWEFPGGKIEVGEMPEACLIREIKEELNIDIQIKSSMSTYEYQYPDKLIRLIPFICSQIGGEIYLNEHAEYKWLDAKELLNMDWAEADVRVIEEYLAQNKEK